MKARILIGDCCARMRELAENSVDAIVTDPPYGIRFMGKSWDGDYAGLRGDCRAEIEASGPTSEHRRGTRMMPCGRIRMSYERDAE